MSHCFKEVVMKNGLINNENNEYIVLSKALYNKYGFVKALILQTLVDNKGKFIGSMGQLSDVIGTVSGTSIKTHMNELVNDGIVKKENVDGWINEYTLKVEIDVALKKKKIPESVTKIMEHIKKLKADKSVK